MSSDTIKQRIILMMNSLDFCREDNLKAMRIFCRTLLQEDEITNVVLAHYLDQIESERSRDKLSYKIYLLAKWLPNLQFFSHYTLSVDHDRNECIITL